ncbi:uncharacterized protein EAF02_011506 [Botrytis sinoallii]|uniref:uncharacterized protein n=1 Tax=Botrytis sinoallii TaxID=1463999 RepID=UPI00190005C8|nr:uncharacterized protein EAF02_011506 [Botrytis sinoallii]KAF7856247.1 hypothetical protein EAF02_011506 [Botrytis sinoallii]
MDVWDQLKLERQKVVKSILATRGKQSNQDSTWTDLTHLPGLARLDNKPWRHGAMEPMKESDEAGSSWFFLYTELSML